MSPPVDLRDLATSDPPHRLSERDRKVVLAVRQGLIFIVNAISEWADVDGVVVDKGSRHR